MKYSWIPFYKELAEKLLQYKNDRSQLIEWIKFDLNKVKTKRGGHSLISYLTKSEYFQQTNDIDPFSVFGIFNRKNQRGDSGRRELLLMFHDKFNLSSDIPTDFDGIPLIEIFSANNFCLRKGMVTIDYLWNFYEKIVRGDDISNDFDNLISNNVNVSDLSIYLYLISPDKFLPLNDTNIKLLQIYEIIFDINSITFETYNSVMKQLQELQTKENIPFNSYEELSATSLELNKTDRIWMWRGDETTFTNNVIACGSDMNGKMEFSSFTSRDDFRAKYQEIKGKLDYITPAAYWDFVYEAKEGESVIVFSNSNGGHILYGWGIIDSHCELDYQNEAPLRRSVKWHAYNLHNIIKESLTQNTRFFHCVYGIEAAHIMNLQIGRAHV